MKVIDLLNKIANKEELPKKMKIKQWEYNAENENLEYELFDRLFEEDIELNDTVEILGEEKKIPEKLGLINYSEDQATSLIHHKVDEIIDYLDYLKSKGE
jgi:hypothetical protein